LKFVKALWQAAGRTIYSRTRLRPSRMPNVEPRAVCGSGNGILGDALPSPENIFVKEVGLL
jgi:hypothetical protein